MPEIGDTVARLPEDASESRRDRVQERMELLYDLDLGWVERVLGGWELVYVG